ncbi:MAG: hypothetical protein CL992_01440 [Euryarchaeota archaeon]|nr:hypothetical protein [Euryarchaeota archaeon]
MTLSHRTLTTLLLVLLLIGAAAPLSHGSSGGRTDSSCSGCHGSADNSVTITLEGLPSQMWSPSTTYRLFVNATSSVGGGKGGFSLDVSAGSLAGVSGSSKVQGGKATHVNPNSRSWQIDWTSPTSGSFVTFDVAANTANGNGQATGDKWKADSFTRDKATNSPPTVSNVAISPALPTVTSPLSVTYSYSDPEANPESGTQIRWERNGSPVGSLDDLTSVSVDDLEKGQVWVVKVTPSDGMDPGAEVTSDPVTIQNTLPTVTSLSISPINPQDDDDLTVVFALFDADDDPDTTYPPMSVEIRWRLEGVLRSEWDNQSTVPFTAIRAGDQWDVTVTPYDRDGEGAGTPSSVSVRVNSSNTPPVVSDVIITPGEPRTGDDLDVSWEFFDGDLDLVDQCTIEWIRNAVHETVYDGLDPLPASATTKDESWAVRVSCSDGEVFSQAVTSSAISINDTPPTVSAATLSPAQPSSSDDIILAWQGDDVDGDQVTEVSIAWFKDAEEVPSLENMTTLSSSYTARGEEWYASVQAWADGKAGSPLLTSSVMILNSPPFPSLLAISPTQPTAASDLTLDLTTMDTDDDTVTISSVRWMRDGFEISELAGETSAPARLLAPGQTWIVHVTLSDGMSTSSEFSSAEVVVGNIPPVAVIITPDEPKAGLPIVLDGSNSSDSDGRITAYFWKVDGESSTGSVTSIILPAGAHDVNLTVLDDVGGRHSTVITLVVGQSPAISGLAAVIEDGMVVLSWTPASGFPDVAIHRTSEGEGIEGTDAIGTTNLSSWSEPIHTIGQHTYVVVVVVDGQSAGSGVPVTVEITQAHSAASSAEAATIEDDNGLQWLMYVFALLTLFAVISVILLPRLRETGGVPVAEPSSTTHVVPSWEHLPTGGSYDQSGPVLLYAIPDGSRWEQQLDGTWRRL